MTLVDDIKSRGYWHVVIRPTDYKRERIARLIDLFPLISKASVDIYGWDFPHIDTHSSPQLLNDYIQQDFDREHFREVWRFYQSGQFVYLGGFRFDWRDRSSWWSTDQGWSATGVLTLSNVVHAFTEILELAARLTLTEAGADRMRVDVLAGNIGGRVLREPAYPLLELRNHTSSVSEYRFGKEYSRDDLLADPRGLALVPAIAMLERFNLRATPDMLKDLQRGLNE